MPEIRFQKPTDQPTGTWRLIDQLNAGLRNASFDEFWLIVAYAKAGPLLRLQDVIKTWRAAKKPMKAIIGVDQKGTSKQALEFALEHFSETHIAHVPGGLFKPTFHPKLYVFSGDDEALAFVGSNNLTVGGTETNLESCVHLGMTRPADDAVLASLEECWTDALRTSVPLTTEILSKLTAAGVVPDEAAMRGHGTPRLDRSAGVPGLPEFPRLGLVPPSAIPRSSILSRAAARKRATAAASGTAPVPALPESIGAQALVIQISPHHNGEIFLSKIAVNQDQAFFGFPFTGLTVPKKASNAAYPQREPDPVVDLKVYDGQGRRIIQHHPFNLNTVFYAPKSEIRITVPHDVVEAVPEFSVMVMRKPLAEEPRDYDIDIFTPGSHQYVAFLAKCNQTMPTGGKAQARRFGWL